VLSLFCFSNFLSK